MSSMTIVATFAFAMPMTESGPVWSVMTPTLIGPSADADSFIVRSFGYGGLEVAAEAV